MHRMQKIRLSWPAEEARPTATVSANTSQCVENDVFSALPSMPAAAHTAAISNVCLPVSPTQLANYASNASSSPSSILVIDDSSTVRKIIEISLSDIGYVVISFPDGVAALRWLMEGSHTIPDLVLLDISLPKIDGYEFARILKAKPALQRMTIIMMSRRNGTVDRLKGRLAGAKDYLSKPFQTKELVETVNHYLRKNRDERQQK